jgi:hypothetical protein
VSEELRLPPDLVEFLGAGESLEYDEADAEPGMLLLRRLDELFLGELYVSSRETAHDEIHDEPGAGEDPHIEDVVYGHYVIPAVDLVASCSGGSDLSPSPASSSSFSP